MVCDDAPLIAPSAHGHPPLQCPFEAKDGCGPALLELRRSSVASRDIAGAVECVNENIVRLGRNQLCALHAGRKPFKKCGLILGAWLREISDQYAARCDQQNGGGPCSKWIRDVLSPGIRTNPV